MHKKLVDAEVALVLKNIVTIKKLRLCGILILVIYTVIALMELFKQY